MNTISKICIATLLSTVYGQASLAQASLTKSEEFLLGKKIEVIGGMGGDPVVTPKNVYISGSIKNIFVCSGSRVDSIKITYGATDGPYIGNPGGACENIKVDVNSKITAVRVFSGSWIDGIQFQIDGDWKKVHGTEGGRPTTYNSVEGGGLAFIDGRVGSKIDQLSFGFGLPYYIKDVVYDGQAIAEQIDGPIEPSRLGQQCFVNNTPSDQTAKKSWNVTKAETANWNSEVATTWGIGVQASFGIAGIGEAGYSANFGQTYTDGKGGEISESTTVSDELNTVVAPWTNIMTTFEANQRFLKIPFTYNLIHYNGTNRSDVASTRQFSSVFEGVSWSNGNVRWNTVEDCGNTITSQLGAPSERGVKPSDTNHPPVQPPAPNADNTPELPTPELPTPELNGETVVAATFNGGSFEHISGKTWGEFSASGDQSFTFEETGRDEWSVYLRDTSRNVDIAIDLWQKKIKYGSTGGAMSDLYTVTDAEAGYPE